MTVDLQKKLDLRKEIIYDLAKKANIGNQKARVVVALDYSGSMDSLYRNGSVQTVLERITPLAMQFDDDGDFELYLFETGVKQGPTVSLNNLEGFIKNKIDGKYNYGGTNYAPVINRIVKDYGNTTTGSFIKSLFGSKSSNEPAKLPTYVLLITDGENSDRSEAEKAIVEAAKHGIFFKLIGLGHSRFSFLEKLDDLKGRFIDNADFFTVKDFAKVSDDELYSDLLNEFPEWLKEARTKNLIL